jgi:hypothetical protein
VWALERVSVVNVLVNVVTLQRMCLLVRVTQEQGVGIICQDEGVVLVRMMQQVVVVVWLVSVTSVTWWWTLVADVLVVVVVVVVVVVLHMGLWCNRVWGGCMFVLMGHQRPLVLKTIHHHQVQRV